MSAVKADTAVPAQAGAPEATSAGSDEQLEDRLRLMKAEIDGLQVAAAERNRPWFRQPSIIISVLALVLSLASTGYGTWLAEQQHVREARAELAQLIQRLSALPKENLELQTSYASNATVLAQLASAVNAENLVLARQAADIVERRIPDHVSAIECYAVASALIFSSDFDTSRRLLELGLARANDPVSHSTLLRAHAAGLYRSGDVAAGRERMQAARDIFSRYPTKVRSLVVSTTAHTELYWVGLERGVGDCAEARRHLSEVRHWAAQIPPGPERNRVETHLRTNAQALATCAPGPLSPSQP